MASWSGRRRLLYASIILGIAVVAIAVPAFFIFYKAPTCTDGLMNGTEQGIDCGGSCSRLCASAFLSPQVAWTRFEEVAPGIYNFAAYIVNPNPDGEAKNVPYRVTLYDAKGETITDFDGSVTLPPQRNTLAYRGALPVGKRAPIRAFFEFTAVPEWTKRNDPLSRVTILDREYVEEGNSSSLTVTLKNTDLKPLGKTTVYVVLYDASGNTLGFSRTVVDGIPAGGTAIAPFTWPRSRNGKVISIDVLPVAE